MKASTPPDCAAPLFRKLPQSAMAEHWTVRLVQRKGLQSQSAAKTSIRTKRTYLESGCGALIVHSPKIKFKLRHYRK
uniref:Uncharacterized protein n=1 Tax=mine drainage metagenome TaxID=410659 RepID=E6QXC0_9ZZZZ